MKLYKSLFLFLLLTKLSYSQSVLTSNAFVEACYNKTECYGLSNSALIFLNNSGEFVVQVDFNNFKLGNDTLDDWLNDLSKSSLLFKGILKPSEYTGMLNINSKPIIVNGSIKFNGVTKPYNLELHFFINSRERTLLNTAGLSSSDQIAISSIQIVFHAKDFNIGNRRHHFTKTIRVVIGKGYINEWTPETDLLINH